MWRPVLLGCLTLMAGVAPALAAEFACPKPGTVEQRGPYTLTYTGALAGDPEVCTLKDSQGKPARRLFNIYSLSDTNNTSAANAAARAGVRDMISGKKTSVSFPYTASNAFVITETWTYLRTQPYTVSGKTVQTMVFQIDRLAGAGGRSGFHGQYTDYLDPQDGLWLKSSLQVIAGEIAHYPQGHTDTNVTFP